MSKYRINKYTHIFFISIFLAFSAFALYLSFCDAYNYKGDFGKMFLNSLLFSFIICILCVNHNVWYNLARLVASLLFLSVIVKYYKLIETECGILYQYIKKQYYLYEGLGNVSVNKIRTSVKIFGIPVYEKFTMIIAVFLVITIMALAVLKLKWYFLLILPVISIIGMEMFHGKAPSVAVSFFLITGISGLLFSMRLEMYGGRKNFWQEKLIPGQMPKRYSLFIIVSATCFAMSLIAGKATSHRIFTCSGKMLERQHKMEKEIVSFAETVKRRVNNGADGHLDNSSPEHTGKSVIRIETSQKPANNIYIKHFSLDIYENGIWKPFKENKPPVPETNISQEAVNSLKSFISLRKNAMSGINTFNLDVIKDWKFIGKDTFMPYMYDASQQSVYYDIPGKITKYLMAMDNGEMELCGIKGDKEYTSFVYNNYFEVPYGLSRLKAFADEIITVENMWLECAAVKNAICKDTKYSQNLNALPDGEEYIEYFLFSGKKGYCEHYATAGTILLRMKGVPARYVSGYFIMPSEFNAEYDKYGNKKYVAYVKDYNAHAWTEVYKEGFGWLPFDMTNTVLDDGYNSDAGFQPGTEGDFQEKQDNHPATAEPEDTLNEDGFGQEDLQEDTREETGTNREDSNVPEKKGKAQASRKNDINITGKFLMLLLILLIVSMPVLYIRAGFIKTSRKIRYAGTANKRVILYFNLLNKYLAFCGFKGISKLEDKAYYSMISAISANIASEVAFGILQCAAFSNNNVNADDEKTVMEFIQKISGSAYKRCGRMHRLIIYILTGRKGINIFTKAYN